MKNILNRGFGHLSIDAFVTKVMFIITQLTANAYFPVIKPTLAQLQAALDVITTALVMPNPTARDAAVAAGRVTMEQMLDDLADDLEETAALDPVKLSTTGFEMHKPTTQTGEAPETPQNVRLKLTGVSGEAQVLLDASDRSKGYEVQTTADPMAGPWTTYDTFSSVRGIVLKGFPRKQDIWVRVRALGPNNTKSGWSDPATILIA